MIFTDLNLVGEAIRNYRKEKKLRLEDLADENISVSTISNIERGFAHVKQEKLQYLLEKLGIDMEDINHIEGRIQKKDEQITLQLAALDSWLICDEYSKALSELIRLDLPDNHPLAARATYVKGKCYFKQGEIKKAIQSYHEAIRLARLQEDDEQFVANCYYELSFCALKQNKGRQAFAYVEKGLALIEKKQSELYISLLCSKAELFMQQAREAEALKLVKDTWPYLQKVQKVELTLGFYRLRVALLISANILDEALVYVEEGIKLATQNSQHNALSLLWAQIGEIYLKQHQAALAEISFRTSQLFEYHVDDKSILIATYRLYGSLLRELKRYNEADIMLNKAILLGEKHQKIVELIHAYLEMGQVQLIADKQRAMNYFHKARELAANYQLPQLEYEAIFQVAKVYQELDSEKFVACTIEMYKLQSVMNGK